MKDSSFILDRFIEKLSELSSFKDVLIIVPTARVGSYILGSLAKRLKIFNSPMILSLDNFILNFSFIQKDINKYKKDDILILFYLYSYLQHLGSKYLKPYSIDKIYQFFSFMNENSLDSGIFLKIKELFQNSYQSSTEINHIIEKLNDIESLYSDFTSLPIKTSSFIKKIATQSFIKALETDPNILKKYYSSIYIVSDIYPSCYKQLLTILEKKDNVFFIKDRVSDVLSFDSSSNSKEENLDIFQNTTPLNHKIKTYFFNSFIQECFFITKKIKTLIQQGIPSSQISVVLLNEKKYTPVLKELFKKYEIPSNFTSATSVKNSSLSNWISECLLFKTPKDDTNAFLYKFLTTPLSIAIVSYNNQELFHDSSIHYTLEEFFEHYTIEDAYLILSNIYSIYLSNSNSNSYSVSICDKNSSLYKLVEPLFSKIFDLNPTSPSHSYLDFYKTFDTFYKFIEPYVSIVYKDDPYSLKTMEAFSSFIDYFSEINCLFNKKYQNYKLNLVDINFLFSDYINKSLYWDRGSSLKGVQVLKLPETSYFPFTSTFILGCSEQNNFSYSEGLFPSFIENKLNLNKNQELLRLNQSLFSSLLKNSFSTTLSFSQDDLLYFNPHRYLQILDSKNLVEYINLKDLKIYDKNINKNDFTNKYKNITSTIKITDTIIKKHCLSKTNLSISTLSHLSVSLIQNLMDCPYKFILTKYLPSYRYPSSSLIPLDEGKLVHKIFETYIKDLPKIEKKERKSYILSLLEKNSSPSFKLKDLYFHLKNYSLDRFIDFIDKIETVSEPNLTSSKVEFKIPAFNLKLSNNLDITVEGRIDRLDTLNFMDQNIYLLTDYKISDYSIPTIKDTKSGKISQLLIYTHVLNNPSISGYWDIKKGKWSTFLCSDFLHKTLFTKKKKNESLSDLSSSLDFLSLKPSTASLEDSYEKLIDNLETTVHSIKEHDCFYMNLEHCSKCYFSNICKNKYI